MIKQLIECGNTDTLSRLFLGNVPPEHRHTTVTAIESIIADCQARIKDLNEQTLAELELGADVPGFKLKAGSERRSWRDESQVCTVLAEYNIESAQLHDMKLKGIPAVDKVLSKAGYKPDARKAILDRLVDVKVGNPSLVKEK